MHFELYAHSGICLQDIMTLLYSISIVIFRKTWQHKINCGVVSTYREYLVQEKPVKNLYPDLKEKLFSQSSMSLPGKKRAH